MYGGSPEHRIGGLARFQELHADGKTKNRMDAAIVKLDDGIECHNHIPGRRLISGLGDVSRRDQTVYKYGSRTGWTQGRVDTTSYRFRTSFGDDVEDSLFMDQIRIVSLSRKRPFTQPGDSGALVVRKTKKKLIAVALLFGASRDGREAVASPIKPVFDALEIDLI